MSPEATQSGSGTRRLTVAQALLAFLANQWTERDGVRHRLIAGCSGIFGHGNVAGIGEALRQYAGPDSELTYYQARNEQAMVHTAVGFARMSNRLSTLACTTSIGPGATNLVTGAALATINRLPVLLLPGDIFATRVANPVLQELEDARSFDVSVNDCLRPVSVYWDRINRPEQLISSALAAMRTLADPAETGAVTLALPQDVQAEAADWPEEFFATRVWYVERPLPEPAALERATATLRAAERPLIVAGGGVIYSEATEQLAAFAEQTGIPVAETQAGKGALSPEHPCAVGAIGATGTTAANALARDADVVLGIGTRYSDFTTASHTLFSPDVRVVNLNVSGFDTAKLSAQRLRADARSGIDALRTSLADWQVEHSYRARVRDLAAAWEDEVSAAYRAGHRPLPAQTEVLGAVNELTDPTDVVINAAGSMPGELHKLFRARDPKQYHVEYGYSCMGYEIAAGLGVKLAAPEREVVVLVGDGSYLMLAQEIVTAVAEGVKLTIVLVQNHGYASIGSLSETVGAQRFGTSYRYRNPRTGTFDGEVLPVDLAANAASLGAQVLRANGIEEFREAFSRARRAATTTVVQIETDPHAGAPSSRAWWDVPVAEVSTLESARRARADYDQQKPGQQQYL